MRLEGVYVIRRQEDSLVSISDAKTDARRDIRSLTFVPSPDGLIDSTLCVGFADGALVKVTLPCKSMADGHFFDAEQQIIKSMSDPGDAVLGLSSYGNMLLSLTASGKARLTNLYSSVPNSSALDSSGSSYTYSTVDLQTRSWSALLTPSYAVFGCSSMATPLALHSITETGLSPSPSYILGTQRSYLNSLLHPMHLSESTLSAQASRNLQSTAVYGLCAPPPSFPSGSLPGQVLISGWFDGFVRIYDLRSSKRTVSRASLDEGTTPHLAPVLSLSDPWSLEPLYAVSAGGSSGSHIAAGSARHSVISFWDVRSPTTSSSSSQPANNSYHGWNNASDSMPRNDSSAKSGVVASGWSVHGPGNDSSPVYDVIMESSRVWGVTQSRAFVYDFGPNVTRETYPALKSDSLLGMANTNSREGGSDSRDWRHRSGVQLEDGMNGLGNMPATEDVPGNMNRRGGYGRREQGGMRGLPAQNFGGLKGADNGVGYYVTVYKHSSGMYG